MNITRNFFQKVQAAFKNGENKKKKIETTHAHNSSRKQNLSIKYAHKFRPFLTTIIT